MSFSELGLSPKVLAAVEASGYTTPTPIQAQAIPHVLARRDVVGIAQTGTGKTASFVLPMITLLEQGRARARMPRTLILEPTRELAAQVEENFTRYGQNHKLNVALLIGGVSFDDQIKKLDRGVDILIATPGRLLDHFERGKILMNGVEILVIDEADRMLDMGFIPDIERICKLLPFTRQTLFFSATMPPEIKRLTDQFLSNPVRVEASKPATAATTVKQQFGAVGPRAGRKARGPALAPAQRRRPQERDHLLQSQARRRDVAALAGEARLLCRRAAWRHGPALAHADARRFPQGQADHPRRQRRRGARSRYPGGQPHLQFRRSDPCRGLRPPHRPDRSRRTVGHRDHHRHVARPQICFGNRKTDRAADRGGSGRGVRRACGSLQQEPRWRTGTERRLGSSWRSASLASCRATPRSLGRPTTAGAPPSRGSGSPERGPGSPERGSDSSGAIAVLAAAMHRRLRVRIVAAASGRRAIATTVGPLAITSRAFFCAPRKFRQNLLKSLTSFGDRSHTGGRASARLRYQAVLLPQCRFDVGMETSRFVTGAAT